MTLPAWVPPPEQKPAPAPLLLVQAFVNTRDLDLGTDLLADPGLANRWLHQSGLLAPQHKKALLRCLIDKVVIRRIAADSVEARIVWRGGDTTTAAVF